MNDVYKTMKGVPVDMNKLRMQNEKTVAVGNMKVNAKGDLLGKGGKVVKSSQQRVRDDRKTTNNIVNNKSLKKEVNEDDLNVISGTPKKTPVPNKKKKQTEKELPDGSIEIIDDGENL